MPVIDAENRVVLKPDHVFIIPPLTETTTNGVVLYVRASSGPKQEGWPVTISAFLFSLATTCKARAVVVILSGMGDDGSSALASIKAKGGATLVQSDPSYKSMPDSANCTGFVDHVLTATNIGKHLAAMC
jgi:two-component system CheB/CheR fusion protein